MMPAVSFKKIVLVSKCWDSYLISQDLKIESDIQEAAEPEDDLDIMLGNKKKKKKNVKFPDEDEILEKDEGNIGAQQLISVLLKTLT